MLLGAASLFLLGALPPAALALLAGQLADWATLASRRGAFARVGGLALWRREGRGGRAVTASLSSSPRRPWGRGGTIEIAMIGGPPQETSMPLRAGRLRAAPPPEPRLGGLLSAPARRTR